MIMSELRKECYKCCYYNKCYEKARYDSEYCKSHMNLKKIKMK